MYSFPKVFHDHDKLNTGTGLA